ncbi:MAG: VCBS repeat-containing protein [Alphaproteobacteria bacterium]|nr:VCBS repeat-containing protein [Alphaproteobacteria bacterium]
MPLIGLALLGACVDYGLEKVSGEGPQPGEARPAEPLCPTERVEAEPLSVVDLCPDPELPYDPFALEIEWQYEDHKVLMHPVIASLNDDDGDGDIDGEDIPDIVVVDLDDWEEPGTLRALSGDGSGELLRSPHFDAYFGPAIGDIDGDGLPEIVGVMGDYRVRALDHTGAVKWTSDPVVPSMLLYFGQVALADFEGDGHISVIAGSSILSGADGRIEQVIFRDHGHFTPVVADIDLDGRQELLIGDGVYTGDGERLWATPWTTHWDCAPAVAQLDEDDEAEVMFACWGEINIHEHDGTLITSFQPVEPVQSMGAACIGDITGDGAAEILIPNSVLLVAYTPAGEILWETQIVDASSAAGCSLFDLDGDGAQEVLYGDEVELMILDGRTGARLFSDRTRGSDTGYDYPVVADVDGDGQSEVVVVASGHFDGYQGVAVYGHPEGLPASGPIWPSYDYDTLKLDDDGRVVAAPEPFWLAHNLFHGRPAYTDTVGADLVVQVDSVCVEGCAPDSLVHIALRLGNQGPVDAEAVRVTLQGADGAVLRETVVGPLPSGQMGATRVWRVPYRVFADGAPTLTVSPTAQVECGPADNVITVPRPRCGGG